MASTAFDSPDTEAAARPPLSTHPAFPAIVALWFAALLGLGSLVLPAALFESAFVAVGLTSLVPLGVVTRLLIALALAGGGALAGLAIARRVAQAHARQVDRERADSAREAPRRPLDVREDLDEIQAPVTRRRARALLAAEPGRDTFHAPPPAGEDAADLALPADDVSPPPVPEEDGIIFEQELFGPRQEGPAPARVDNLAAPDRLGLVQLVERLGSSLERRREWLAQAPAAPATPQPAPASFDAAIDDFDAAAPTEAAQAMADYFGRSLAPLAEPGDRADEPFDMFSLPLARPVALEPFMPEDAGTDEDDDADDCSFGSLLAMRGAFALKDAEPARDQEPHDGDGEPSAPACPAGQSMPRPFDPPAEASQAPIADTDAQLREALAALQQMRGAA